jgi:hypothetical protein
MQKEECEPTCVIVSPRFIVFDLQLLTYLDLQDIISTDPLVVHLVIGIIGIATALVLDEGKAREGSAGILRSAGEVSIQSAGCSAGAGMSQRTRRP